ncbi:MAG: glycerophosphodiester phosphodiesterase [Clostridia bacterium]|nr:glycerophosphodiester phosphodiesterase [Clostridia bacterium]
MLIGILLLALLLFALLWLFLILPRTGESADTDHLWVDYAHRGLHTEGVPENSLSAFSRAVRAGYGIELDVRRTRDGAVVVCHDDDLFRVCGVRAKVSGLTLSQIKRLTLKNSTERIPTLSEVLSLVGGRVPLMIEIKGERADPRLLKPLAELLDGYMGPFSVISFSPLILSWFKSYRPSFARGQLVTVIRKHDRRGSRAVNFLLSHMLLNVLSRPDFLSVNGHLRNRPSIRLVARLLKKGGFLWTIRKKEEYLLCKKEGYFAVFEEIAPPKRISNR